MTSNTASVKYARGKHPNTLRNLKSYPPGVNGNPKPGNSLTAMLKNALQDRSKEGKLLAIKLIESTIEGAIKREPTPFKELWDRVEGKVPQPVVGDGGGPVIIKIVWDGNDERLRQLPAGQVVEGKAREVEGHET